MKPEYAKRTYPERSQCLHFFSGGKSQPSYEIYEAMAKYDKENNVGRDFYGEGKFLNQFEVEIASLLGKPAALFMPSGAMAQQIALRIVAEEKNNFKTSFHGTSQLELNENHAYSHLHKLQATLVGEIEKQVLPADVEKLSDEASFLLELPMRQIGGTLPSWNDLEEIKKIVHSKNIFFHMDGARLWECQDFYQKSYADICNGFDSIYVSMYKGIGGLSGAMLVGEEGFINQARVWLRRHGGNLFNLTPYALSAKIKFDKKITGMPELVSKAKEISSGLSKLDGIEVRPPLAQTHMFHIHFDCSPEQLIQIRKELVQETHIWPFQMVAPDNQGKAKTEFVVGSATLENNTEVIIDYFKNLVKQLRK